MSSIINILDDTQRREFDRPPKFTYVQRKIMFSMPEWAEKEIETMSNPIYKTGFILQLGYFKASGRFFKRDSFFKDDFAFVIRRFKMIEIDHIVFKENYQKIEVYRHRQLILENTGILPFVGIQKEKLYQEALRLLKKQANPRNIFYLLASFLRSNQVEVPAYFTLASILTEAIRNRDRHLMKIIQENITPELQESFERMLSINEDSNEKNYLLTQLRKSRELMRPQAIKANLKDYKTLKQYYNQVLALLPLLDISDEMIQYYARFVLRSQVFQVIRKENKYLMLLCFIVYQYRFLGDLLIDTFLRSTQQFENAAKRASKDNIYQNHIENQATLEALFELNERMIEELNTLQAITLDGKITEKEKEKYWVEWVNSDLFLKFKGSKGTISRLRKGDYIKKDEAYYQVLEEKSRQLQYRVSDMLRHLDFDCNNENLKLAWVILKPILEDENNITFIRGSNTRFKQQLFDTNTSCF